MSAARHSLLIPLVGPMQAWGSRSRFDDRDTNTAPTKSGVVGLVCCAMGWGRDADPKPFETLTFGVRVDAPGRVMTDYQTAQRVTKADGSGVTTVQSRRHYLADARFLVGFCGGEGELCLLRDMAKALRNPRWPLFLGRKSFPLTLPPYLPNEPPIREGVGLREAFETAPYYLWRERSGTEKSLRLILDAAETEAADGGASVADRPLSFRSQSRRYAPRRIADTETLRRLKGEPHPCSLLGRSGPPPPVAAAPDFFAGGLG